MYSSAPKKSGMPGSEPLQGMRILTFGGLHFGDRESPRLTFSTWIFPGTPNGNVCCRISDGSPQGSHTRREFGRENKR